VVNEAVEELRTAPKRERSTTLMSPSDAWNITYAT
jgi:hypothetical protein